MATARFHDHVRVLFKHHVIAVIKVQDRYGGEFGGRTTRLRYNCRVHEMNQCLYNGVIGSVHMRAERERAFTVTEKRRVTLRCDNPVLPTKPLEAHVQHPTAAALGARALEVSTRVGELRSEGAR